MERVTTYAVATHWLSNSNLILCNQITEIDPSVFDNFRFDAETEVYQYFLTALSLEDVQWLEKSFGLLFSYSNTLDLYVLCVDHCGTIWAGVDCPCYNDGISDESLKDAEEKYRNL